MGERFKLEGGHIVSQMRIPEIPNWFALGLFDLRVTMSSQQIRALNLAYALLESGTLSSRHRVAVIGAGISGVTFAAALSQNRCRVHLFEKKGIVIPIQSGNHTRYVHPNIYHWPAKGSDINITHLPILNWEAASAGTVADSLTTEWKRIRPVRGVTEILNVSKLDADPTPISGKYSVNWIDSKRNMPGVDRFDFVVFAVGYGIEVKRYGVDVVPYWEDDNCHQELNNASVLVSGTGDGGLIDLLRFSLHNFKHENILEEFIVGTKAEIASLKRSLLEIERKAGLQLQPDLWISDAYRKIKTPTISRAIELRMRNVNMTLNGVNSWPLSRKSSVLHRFLVSRLLKLGVGYTGDGISSVDAIGGRYRVKFSRSEAFFDKVIIRHGAESSFEKDFPTIAARCESLRNMSILDQSRYPIWQSGFCQAVSK